MKNEDSGMEETAKEKLKEEEEKEQVKRKQQFQKHLLFILSDILYKFVS